MLAGGCFWGVQGVFQHVKGVTSAVSGYAGGDKETAHYEMVGTGTTGHAESVRVTFDPRQISYGRLLQIYFSVAHDPTQLNRQGPDTGTQYRSAIFPTSPEQAKIAKAYIAQLDAAHAFPAAIVTKIEPDRGFYRGRGLSPGFPDAEPDLPLHRVQRPAEGREPEEHVPRQLPRRSRARFGRSLLSTARSANDKAGHGAGFFIAGKRLAYAPSSDSTQRLNSSGSVTPAAATMPMRRAS